MDEQQSKSVCICKEIACPYFCQQTNGFGCRRYTVSGHCHLNNTVLGLELRNNQYALYSDDHRYVEPLKAINNKFFSSDEKYRDDRAFQVENADWLDEKEFKVGAIIDD